tara:strand:- start:5446 stop:6105 length:660 start_codon:yes stop_codon:yes gene_type:complete
MSKKNAHLLQMTALVVVAGLVSLISSSATSTSLINSMSMFNVSHDQSGQGGQGGSVVKTQVHENILVESDDEVVTNIDNESVEKKCESTDTPCDPMQYGSITSGEIGYMDTCGNCQFSGECLEDYVLKNDICVYSPGDPYHDPNRSRDPSASCQANAQWISVDDNLYDIVLNCDRDGCRDAASDRYCFKRESQNNCEGVAYRNTATGETIQNCVWITPK